MSDFWKITFCKGYKVFCEAVRNLLTLFDEQNEVIAPLQKIWSTLKEIPFNLGHPVYDTWRDRHPEGLVCVVSTKTGSNYGTVSGGAR